MELFPVTIDFIEIVSTLSVTFFAGLVTSFLPCTFPVLVGYVGLLTGDKDSSNMFNALLKAWLFFLGFSFTFALFGAAAGLFGQFSETAILVNNLKPLVTLIGGIFFIFIGFITLQLIPLPGPLRRIYTFSLPEKERLVGSPIGAAISGVVFAAAWTPCIGPVLGGVLFLSATSGSALIGAGLTFVFSLGILIILSIIAILYSVSAKKLEKMSKFIPGMRIFGGILFIVLGILFITGDIGFFGNFTPPEFAERFI